MAKTPIPEFEASIKTYLEPLGFVRRRGQYVRRIDEVQFGWLGFSRGTNGGVLRVHPNVGIGHHGISDLVEAGRPRPPNTPPSLMPVVFAPLYTLLDRPYAAWDLLPGEDVEPSVRDLAWVIGDVGIPFMDRFVALDDFVDGMRARLVTGDVDYNLPAALMLSGRPDEAEVELRKGLDRRFGHDNEWAESYRRFAHFLVPGIRATPGSTPVAPAPSSIRTTPEALEADLRAYGESALAARAAQFTDAEMEAIGERAFDIATSRDRRTASGMLLAKALALAAVEVIEGRSRDLRRPRRLLRAKL